jgi:hypothetical protein
MTPEQQDTLDNHIDGIAKILYADTDPETLTTLEGIERTVRDKMLEHVSPKVGVFLSAALLERQLEEHEP